MAPGESTGRMANWAGNTKPESRAGSDTAHFGALESSKKQTSSLGRGADYVPVGCALIKRPLANGVKKGQGKCLP